MPETCSRCRKAHPGTQLLCERCRAVVTEEYVAGPSAIPELLAVVAAARAAVVTSPIFVHDIHRELAAALRRFERVRLELDKNDVEVETATPNARRLA